MRCALTLGFLLVISICSVSLAHAGAVEEIMLKFVYGVVGFLLVALTGCITFIVHKFNSNFTALFAITTSTRRDIATMVATCKEREKHCPAVASVVNSAED